MPKNDSVYIKLQRHLDRQAVGFPATKSGAEIRMLKRIFSPRAARIATCLSYQPEPLERIYTRARNLVSSSGELTILLDQMVKAGGLEVKMKAGQRHYCILPLIVGMFELQVNKLTPEFLDDYHEYISDHNFRIQLISTKLPQMRTIPISKSIRAHHHASHFDEVAALLQQARAPFVIFECICRKKNALDGGTCKVTNRKDTCLAIGSIGQTLLLSGIGTEITLDESLAILDQNQKQGLVLQPSNTKTPEFVCSCCGCCCGMLGWHQSLPRPVDFWASNFYAQVDCNACNGCGNCEKRCQVGAVSLPNKGESAIVDLNRCLGCGVCIPVCPSQAMSLLKKPTEVKPPQTREDLYDIIMTHKKGRLDKWKVIGKLVADCIKTGNFDLLKKIVFSSSIKKPAM